ncbi:hypothetical protein ABZ372_14060 [Streptomyces sp. NPDC005921]
MSDPSGHDGVLDPVTALARVHERLARFRAGETAAVLTEEATAEAARAVSERPTPEGVAAVAWLYEYRALAVEEVAGEDAQLALTLFGKVARVLPREVPTHVSHALAMLDAPAHDAILRVSRTVADAEQLMESGASAGPVVDSVRAMMQQSIGAGTDSTRVPGVHSPK